MSASVAGIPHGIRPVPTDAAPLLPAWAARLVPFAALLLFGALHWTAMVSPRAPGEALVGVACAVALAGLLLAVPRRLPAPVRAPAAVGLAGAALLVALVAMGLDATLLLPAHWGELASGVGQGIDGLSHSTVPYRGADAWTRLDIVLGAGLVSVLAALAAFWPGRVGAAPPRRTLAVVCLGLLYVVPAVQINFSGQFAQGALFALLLAAFLWLEGLGRPDAPAAGLATAGALAIAVMLAPALDRSRPWLDYQHWSLSLSSAKAAVFDWTHRYGPLDWPRDGREVLTVKAKYAAYWKTENLDDFDGVRWRSQPLAGAASQHGSAAELAARHPDWVQTATFSIRALRSSEYVGAGSTLRIVDPPPRPLAQPAGLDPFRAASALRRGDAYKAVVYTPRPSAGQLAASRPDASYDDLQDDVTILLPPRGVSALHPDQGAFFAQVVFPTFGSGSGVLVLKKNGLPVRGDDSVLRDSPYAPMWALAQRLSAQSGTVYGYIKRVQAYLARGFRYREDVSLTAYPLESFLFSQHEGYCQQFSGAMALLLRMGGIPARVATGFSPGSFDRTRKAYVVRDIDAHSWVEAWFPTYGWVPFDPTPSIAPPRSQASGDRAPSAASGDIRDTGGVSQRGPRAQAPSNDRGWFLPLAGVATAAFLIVLGLLALARRRPREDDGDDPVLAELERALRRSGRTPEPGVTLGELERRFRDSPAAVAYLRAVARARFGRAGRGPTPAERRAMREALGEGLGTGGRLRAWWALPPRRRPLR